MPAAVKAIVAALEAVKAVSPAKEEDASSVMPAVSETTRVWMPETVAPGGNEVIVLVSDHDNELPIPVAAIESKPVKVPAGALNVP